jgi:uncharacterized membrane protein YhfC
MREIGMLTVLYGVSVFLMIVVPVILAAGLRRVSTTPWILFGVGSLTFVLSQAVHLPLNAWLAELGLLPGSVSPAPPVLQTAVIAGLTAGLCEELFRTAGFGLVQRLRPAWTKAPDAVMLGLGHGGIESMVFGGVLTAATVSALLPLIGADLQNLGLTPQQLDALLKQLDALTANPWQSALPLLERILALSAHVVFSLMIWKAFTGAGGLRRKFFYIPLAVLYHAFVDFAAVLGMDSIADRPLLFEAIFLAILIPGYLWAARQIRDSWKATTRGLPAAPHEAACAAKGRCSGPPSSRKRSNSGAPSGCSSPVRCSSCSAWARR